MSDQTPSGATEPRPKRRLLQRLRRAGRRRPRHRRLRSTSVLPALLTLGNALAGFASIHYATRGALGTGPLHDFALAACLIGVAMIFDMLDGRVARMTRQTSDFGGQLDSLSDIISFGVAPAVLVARLSIYALRFPDGVVAHVAIERAMWCAAGLYLACAALRLARFNAENVPDESAHMSFRGLPSPAAAAPIGALALLINHMADSRWLAAGRLMTITAAVLPVLGAILGLLMVSRFRYPHVVNQTIRGKRPVSYLVKFLIVLLATVIQPFVVLAVIAVAFALSGPVGWLFGHRHNPHPQPAASEEGPQA